MSDQNISFPLLKLVNEARSTYGLRHQDFGRYQSHCATKVHHLRKASGLAQTTSKAKKYSKKDVTEANATTDKHFQVLLFDSERAWAHSQLLKSTLALPTASTTTKHHLSRRLSRAVLRSDQLLSLIDALPSKFSTTDRAQVAAYHLVLKGSLAFEKNKHEEGLAALSLAHALLSRIASSSETAHGEALANEWIDDIEPMLRFCAYSLQLDISSGTETLIAETARKEESRLYKGYDALVEELEKGGGRLKRETVELKWRGRDIPVRNAQLVGVMLKVNTTLKGLEADKDVGSSQKKKVAGRKEVMGAKRMATYDRTLLVLSEAEEVARQLVEDHKIAVSRISSARAESTSASLALAHSYIVYQLLSVRTKRDLLLIDDTSAKLSARESKVHKTETEFVERTGSKDPKTAAIKIRKQRARVYPGLVKIYDGIVHNLDQIRDLDMVEQDGDFAATVDARIASVKALRSLYLSRSYALVDQFPPALSLNARAKLYSREARAIVATFEEETGSEKILEADFSGDLLPLTSVEFDRLDQELTIDYERFSLDWYSASGGKAAETEPEDLAVDELDLGEKGPKKEKEAFYDIAYNYLAAFDMDSIARRAGLKPTEAEEENEHEPEIELEVAETETPQLAAKESGKGWGFGLFGKK